MTTVRQPKVNAPLTGVKQPVENAAQRMLLLAQMTSSGTATDGEINENPSLPELKVLSGAGSMAYDTADIIRSINQFTPLDVLLSDDPDGGTACVKAITFTGTATAAGSLEIVAGSERNGLANVAIPKGTTNEQAVDLVVTAYSTLTACVATVSENGTTASQADFTLNNLGAEGSGMPLSITGYVPGLTYAVTQETAGAGVVTTTSILDAVGSTRYDAIVAPASWGIAYLETFLDARWNVVNTILDGVAFVVAVDSKANHITALDALNSKSVVYEAFKLEARTKYHGCSIKENPLAIAGMMAAISTLRLTEDADISEIVSSSVDQGDLIGGMHVASLPLANTPTSLPVEGIGFGWVEDDSTTDVTDLNDDGGSVIGNNVANNKVLLGEVLTTYKTDTNGDADTTWKYLNVVQTSSAIREYLMTNMRSVHGQIRLTTGSLVGNKTMANDTSIRSKFLRYCKDLQDEALISAGPDAVEYIDSNLTISVDLSSGQATCASRIPVVVQMREIYMPIEITFNY